MKKRDFNKVNKNDIDPEYGFKDMTYYISKYSFFGIFVSLWKEIFRR